MIEAQGVFIVLSSKGDGTSYEVDLDGPECTCPAFKHRAGPCKHIKAVQAKPNRYARKGEEAPLGPACAPNPGLFTIGHSNHSFEDFLALVNKHGLTAIIDVRSKPYSQRLPQFQRFVLRDALQAQGIDYFWVGLELGGLAKVPVSSPEFQQRMAAVLRMAKVHRVALMCSEGRPEECHRAMKLAAFVHRLPEEVRVPIVHILRDGAIRDSVELEKTKTKKWLWVDFGGKKGV